MAEYSSTADNSRGDGNRRLPERDDGENDDYPIHRIIYSIYMIFKCTSQVNNIYSS